MAVVLSQPLDLGFEFQTLASSSARLGLHVEDRSAALGGRRFAGEADRGAVDDHRRVQTALRAGDQPVKAAWMVVCVY